MHRKQKTAIVLAAVAVVLLASCGERGPCPDCARTQEALSKAQSAITTLRAERNASRSGPPAQRDAREAGVGSDASPVSLTNLLAQKKALEDRVVELEAELRSTRIVARGGAWGDVDGNVPVPQPRHAGQVLAVDKAANVVVISLGTEHGVRPGFRYIVSRGDDYVGFILIADVEERRSAGFWIRDIEPVPVERGDRVRSP